MRGPGTDHVFRNTFLGHSFLKKRWVREVRWPFSKRSNVLPEGLHVRAGAGARWAVGQALTALGAGWATLIHCQHLAAHRSRWRSGCDQEKDASMVVLGHLCKTRHCCGCQQEKQCWRGDSSVPQHGHQM